MSIGSQPPTFGYGDFPPLNLPVRRLTVAECHHKLNSGILHSGDPVELLEGILIEKHNDAEAQFVAVDGELPALPIWRLSPAQFDRMREVGIIEAAEPVELFKGVLVRKPE